MGTARLDGRYQGHVYAVDTSSLCNSELLSLLFFQSLFAEGTCVAIAHVMLRDCDNLAVFPSYFICCNTIVAESNGRIVFAGLFGGHISVDGATLHLIS